MQVVVDLVGSVGSALVRFVLLLRDGEDDIRGTYPELQGGGEQAAVHGSLFAGMCGVGHP